MKRTLRLHKQTLSELTTTEMTSVVGADGTHLTCYTGLTVCGICDVEVVTIESINRPCPTR